MIGGDDVAVEDRARIDDERSAERAEHHRVAVFREAIAPPLIVPELISVPPFMYTPVAA